MIHDLDPFGLDPLVLFESWFKDALAAQIPDANAMTLATVGWDGRPSARIVLLKGVDEGTFRFFTNTHSRKGAEIEHSPFATLVFFWSTLERQIRIEGSLSRLSYDESNAYFQTRPRDSQLGAWASLQSTRLSEKKMLEERFEAFRKQYDGQPIPCPPHWGGYALKPDRMEFWKGQQSRLHDRCVFIPNAQGGWDRERLYP